MIYRLCGLFLAFVLIVPVGASAREKLGYRAFVPGETTHDAWFAYSREHEWPPGTTGVHLEWVTCRPPEASGVDYCANQKERAIEYDTFFGGVLAFVEVDYPRDTSTIVTEIHDQLVAKYGPPAKTLPFVFHNELGANVPYDRYEWDADGRTLTFDEIGRDLGHASLQVFDRKLYGAVKAATTQNHI